MGHRLTQEYVRSVLDYEPNTGRLFWSPHCYHVNLIGKEAGWVNPTQGYRYIGMLKRPILAHRVIWLYVYGKLPKREIDHINCEKDDNRLCNLRKVTRSQNQWNAPLTIRNTSGYKGVCWATREGLFRANIRLGNKQVSLGYFKESEDAARAYDISALANFGVFSKTNKSMGLLK